MTKRSWLEFAIVVALLLVASAFFRFSDVDLEVARDFYSADLGWKWKDLPFCRVLYGFGTYPGALLAIGAACVLILGLWSERLRGLRRRAGVIVLALLIGPGIVVNTTFKQQWGRPRPSQVTEFGGERTFLPVWDKGARGNGESFPSGHSSMGFFLATPWFLLRRSRPGWALAFLLSGLALGSLVGLARMLQGMHFLSDVVWAGGFVYLVGLVTAAVLAPGAPPVPARSLPELTAREPA